VLCIGTDPRNRPAETDPNIYCTEYASFSELFPRAACVVHQGGSGTTAQALRAAKPMIFVPYSHDQPDNARRVRKLGVSRTIARHEYQAARVQAELKSLLDDPAVARRSAEVAAVLATEDCVRDACAGIIAVASNRNPTA
jgi:UDP:flavonoid glycosyltransferase YjiC (YdhE family)